MGIEHTKEFGVYHWDTFDNEIFLITEADTLEEASQKMKDYYVDRLQERGADQVDIVDLNGNIIESYKVG